MAGIWHRGPLGLLEPPEKGQSIRRVLDPFSAILWWRHFSVQIPPNKLCRKSSKGNFDPSERLLKVDDGNGIICKISSFRSPKMAQNEPKSAIFLDDVIGYRGSFTFWNLAKRIGLEKYYLKMV